MRNRELRDLQIPHKKAGCAPAFFFVRYRIA
jgi:hypothetical protein